ncbi:MAG: tRNA (N6-isopentenyl adenosine(37)-C2)-methylthiotransferase MiaB [Deltaproteobacteria bacterium]|jgi:tRNA-2-methylthio-N6-dimethylallyladenosine synthase|nr:tRNA (N6-isopentenyl adenosine(37)-C2)-methylthiotransferase MiaB [Deltaproteobacteria bacterium]
MRRYTLTTFGCQMNVYDSGRLEGLLAERGWVKAQKADEADFIFFNACSIREKAAQRVISRLKEFKSLKKARPNLIVGVGGCLAEQEGANFLKKVPFLSLVAGPRRLTEIPALLDRLDPKGPAIILAGDGAEPRPPAAPASQAAPLSSFVTVMEGCDNFCAYCVVPYLRGREKSREPGEILAEVEGLLARGCREIVLLGQNVNSYAPKGSPAAGKASPFVDLLKRLAAYPELWRLRFTTSHPKDFPPELIELFGSLKTLAPSLHLPLQSGSDSVLKAMGRRYDRAQYLGLVKKLKKAAPLLALSTDVIVGFPGETEEDLADTLSALAEARFDSIYSFKYSDRPQTRALGLPNKIPEPEKARRLDLVQDLQRKITLEINQALVGQELEVLVTGPGRNLGQMSGRSGTNKIVNFIGPSSLYGQLARATIVEAYAASLLGRLATPAGELWAAAGDAAGARS